MLSFIGRNEELSKLSRLLKKGSASLVVVKGRRRIGKSRLTKEFAREWHCQFYSFAGLVPTPETTAHDQRNEFARSFKHQFGAGIESDDWFDLFAALADRVRTGRTVVLLDEISWMAHDDPHFLGKLKNVWDTLLSQNPDLIVVLCGSVSIWIEENILKSKALYGRISLALTVDELSIAESGQLLKEKGFAGSALEKFKILAVTGGVPWYIEHIDPEVSASDNLKQLCFIKDGLLVKEFKYIFNDLFADRGIETCRRIVEYLSRGPAEQGAIAKMLGYTLSGPFSLYLNNLVGSGFVSRHYTWNFGSAKFSRLSKYRLRDNYLTFYLRYIAPNLEMIEIGRYEGMRSLAALPGWDSVMGLQFENLVINNHQQLFERLRLHPEEIAICGPYFQGKTARKPGCQIDYLIQSTSHNLYVCEIKFSRNTVGTEVIDEMKQKIKALKRPKHFECIPILIHAGEVTKAVLDSNYFWRIIDFTDFLDMRRR